MGTRNLIAVYAGGQYRVAQYCQWDGYPGGQGFDILHFLTGVVNETDKLSRFKERCLAARFIDGAEADHLWQTKKEPTLSRDTGARVLQIVYERDEPTPLVNNLQFAADSLMCEWAYVIDLDTNLFEVFRGFNKTQLDPSERFANLTPDRDDYAQVRKVAEWPLYALPSDDALVSACVEPSESEVK